MVLSTVGLSAVVALESSVGASPPAAMRAFWMNWFTVRREPTPTPYEHTAATTNSAVAATKIQNPRFGLAAIVAAGLAIGAAPPLTPVPVSALTNTAPSSAPSSGGREH